MSKELEQYQKEEFIEDYTKTIEILETILKMNQETNYLSNTERENIHDTIKLLTYYIFNLRR